MTAVPSDNKSVLILFRPAQRKTTYERKTGPHEQSAGYLYDPDRQICVLISFISPLLPLSLIEV